MGQIALVAAGVVALVGGLWTIRTRRPDPANEAAGHRARVARPTTMVMGLSLMIVGYHLVSFGLPTGWLTARVPADRLWMLGLGIALALGASLATDRFEQRQDERSANDASDQ